MPVHALPTLEERMTDVRAVMDAVGSKRTTLVGYSEGGSTGVTRGAPRRLRRRSGHGQVDLRARER